jgi:hypothetical protein
MSATRPLFDRVRGQRKGDRDDRCRPLRCQRCFGSRLEKDVDLELDGLGRELRDPLGTDRDDLVAAIELASE